jgi:hypothetical protein
VSSRRPAARAWASTSTTTSTPPFLFPAMELDRGDDGMEKGPRPMVPGWPGTTVAFSGKARGMCQAAAMMRQRTRISPRPHPASSRVEACAVACVARGHPLPACAAPGERKVGAAAAVFGGAVARPRHAGGRPANLSTLLFYAPGTLSA